MAQWLRIRLPMQGTRVRSLVREDPTCHGATKPVCHNYWACALEPASHNYGAHVPQLLKPARLEPVLCNKRSHHNEKPTHRNEDPTQPKINKFKKKRILDNYPTCSETVPIPQSLYSCPFLQINPQLKNKNPLSGCILCVLKLKLH